MVSLSVHYAEIELEGTMHVLNAGKWYKVATDFTQIVQADFDSIPDSMIALPDYAHHENEKCLQSGCSQGIGRFVLHGC
ncbi:MAG: TIGR04141 family sporadically distributed protein [Sphingomonadales bacterium]|nr:TIGR04141 family sporadically distributed protein [Sphingomonadales bacterium]